MPLILPSKTELITKAIFEQLPDREYETWMHVLSPVEIAAYKIATGLKFFDASGTRLLLSQSTRQELADDVIATITSRNAEEYVRRHGFAVFQSEPGVYDGPSNEQTVFDGRDCCRWARLRKKCTFFAACLCFTTYGGWDCITPERHGGSHGNCDSSPECTCKCGHYTTVHTINTIAIT